MKKTILFTSVAFASGVLFANVYNSLVNAVATDSDIPNSVMAARAFFKTVNPGDFFKIFSPASQILTLVSLVLFWKAGKSVRIFLGIALLCAVAGDIFAFTYFHPRSDILFLAEPVPDTETLKKLSAEWSAMNWVRSFILFVGVVCSFFAVDKIYKTYLRN